MATATADDTKAADTTKADTTSADTKTADSKAATDTTAQADGTKAAATTTDDRKATAPHVPESYALTLPEKSPLTGADLDRYRGEVKALGLTQEQAQKYVEAQNTALVAAIAQLDQEGADLKADPELGGTKYETTLKHAARGIKELFGEQEAEAKAFIDRLGLGNNKLLVRALSRFGAKFKEDGPTTPGGQSTPQKTIAQTLYPEAKA